jgi:hypothetical protein
MGQTETLKRRITRVALAMLVTPQILASGLGADVLLIHDHHGDVAHAHLVERQDLKDFDPHREHHEGEHYHEHSHHSATETQCAGDEHGCIIFEVPLGSSYLTQDARTKVARTTRAAPFTPIAPLTLARASDRGSDIPVAPDKPMSLAHRPTEALLRTSNALLI